MDEWWSARTESSRCSSWVHDAERPPVAAGYCRSERSPDSNGLANYSANYLHRVDDFEQRRPDRARAYLTLVVAKCDTNTDCCRQCCADRPLFAPQRGHSSVVVD